MQIQINKFPTTRYQGSKRKLLPWLYKHISPLKFESVLDVFGGTASVSYLFKKMGKKVTYNDYLKFNCYVGKSLIENNKIILSTQDIEFLTKKHKTIKYSTFVQNTFKNIYYTDKENKWIDRFLSNWENFPDIYPKTVRQYKKALVFSAFCQSALKKRPFNLFHRANLYLRLNDVKRSFGNKTSWEGSYDAYFRHFCNEINAHVFSNGEKHKVINKDVSKLNNRKEYDMIYIDPPYIRKQTSGADVDYLKFYYFLEGACNKDSWGERIDYNSKNLCLVSNRQNDWTSTKLNFSAFERLFDVFNTSTIVVSYKEPGIPSKTKLVKLLKKFKKKVISVPGKKYDYALNKNNGFHKEYLLIGLNK